MNENYYWGIEQHLLQVVMDSGLNRIPTYRELIKLGENKLKEDINRTGGVFYWSERLGIPLKESNVSFGWKYEMKIKRMWELRGYEVKKMPVNHPYDLLINNLLKVDVKVSHSKLDKGTPKHEFHLGDKSNDYCDLLILVALDANDNMERVFYIPTNHLDPTLTRIKLGKKSRYNTYLQKTSIVNDLLSDLYTLHELREKGILE